MSLIFSALLRRGESGRRPQTRPLSPSIGYIGYIGGNEVSKIDLSGVSGAVFENRFATDVGRITNRCGQVMQQMWAGFDPFRRRIFPQQMCIDVGRSDPTLLHCNIVIIDRFLRQKKTQPFDIQRIES